MPSRHIPFDSLTLAAVVAEAQELVGGRIQKIWQPEPLVVVLSVYIGAERLLLVSAGAETARAHLVSRRPDTGDLPAFVQALRKHIGDGRVVFVRQRGLDRIMEVGVSSSSGDFQLVAELMGKHSNIMLVDSSRHVLAAAKWVGPKLSRRPVLPGRPYDPPPFDPRPPLTQAGLDHDLRDYEGWSPFLGRLLDAGLPLDEVKGSLAEGTFGAWLSPGHGAYPFDVSRLGWKCSSRSSINQALDIAYAERVDADRLERARASLAAQLRRVRSHREAALLELARAKEAADEADRTQILGELVLAYQGSVQPGEALMEAWDYEGNLVAIPLDPEKSAVANAQALFTKAKKAKARADEVEEQFGRLSEDSLAVESALSDLDRATDMHVVDAVRELAEQRRWLRAEQHVGPKEERPFEGHAIRELVSPGGWRVLYGTNATSNDYLTTKVARPNDWWLHVRGQASSHVVLQTGNHPEKVQRPDLQFAAAVAVRNSPSKHASYVAVDYTLKKHVRKPRGSAPGLATYVQEKTLHVERAE